MARTLKVLGLALIVTISVALLGSYLLAAASLPRRSGAATLPGLHAAVTIELDAHAVPRIRGDSLIDVFRAQGFVHAQERFFQMDLARRSAAGELAALVGRRALVLDREQRVFQFRARSRAEVSRLNPLHRAWLDAYTQGVNAGLEDLGSRPPEYWLLGEAPAPWSIEDSLLVSFTIYTMLSNNEVFERAQAVMAATIAPEVYRFLTPSTSRYDRPLLAGAADSTGGYSPVPIPPASVLDFRGRATLDAPPTIVDPPFVGQAASNQWASDASRGARGQAMLANDPHLSYRLPNLFYRAELYWPGGAARGVSIPGLPGILIGANEHVAWGTTVSYADQSDWVTLELDPEDPGRYRTPDGFEALAVDVEKIRVGAETVDVEVRRSRFGPVAAEDGLGRPLALKAAWFEPDGLSLDVLELVTAESVEAALAIVERWSGPALSWTFAGSDGSIGWALNGPIPDRFGYDGSAPESWADGTRGWRGYVDLPSSRGTDGIVFNANNRSLPIPDSNRLSRIWMRSHRAQRIAELLATDGDALEESDFFRMQLDTRARAYDPIRDLVLELVATDETDPSLAAARRYAAAWNGGADADEPGFRILQAYYRELLGQVLAPLLEPAYAEDPRFVYRWLLADEPLMRLLEERPAHLVPPGYGEWRGFLRGVLVGALETIEHESDLGIDAPWGLANRLDVAHPLADLPLIGRRLRLPAEPQAGSAVSVRVATPVRGSVIRMVVSPADPAAGILQMAGGQSGHFLSRHFKDLHADWAGDRPTPFLAGSTESTLTLLPDARDVD